MLTGRRENENLLISLHTVGAGAAHHGTDAAGRRMPPGLFLGPGLQVPGEPQPFLLCPLAEDRLALPQA